MTTTILVVTGEHAWTLQALHLAAAMARETGASLLLVECVRVSHLEYLGLGLREALLPYDRLSALHEYSAAVRDYGVEVAVAPYEYTDYVGGLLSAVEQVGPLAVFAPAPRGRSPLLAAVRLWHLRRALRRPLYTLSESDGAAVWTPASPAETPSNVASAIYQ